MLTPLLSPAPCFYVQVQVVSFVGRLLLPGARPPRLDRGDSSSSSGGQVEPPKRSRGSRGKETYQSMMELNKADFRAWRTAFNYDEPQDPDIDNCFWSPQMEKLHKDLYLKLYDIKKVCPHRVIDFAALEKKSAYFGGSCSGGGCFGSQAFDGVSLQLQCPSDSPVICHRGF